MKSPHYVPLFIDSIYNTFFCIPLCPANFNAASRFYHDSSYIYGHYVEIPHLLLMENVNYSLYRSLSYYYSGVLLGSYGLWRLGMVRLLALVALVGWWRCLCHSRREVAVVDRLFDLGVGGGSFLSLRYQLCSIVIHCN